MPRKGLNDSARVFNPGERTQTAPQSSNRCAHLQESYRPYGTALLGWRCPRHFVPGYDRTVPPGHFAAGFS